MAPLVNVYEIFLVAVFASCLFQTSFATSLRIKDDFVDDCINTPHYAAVFDFCTDSYLSDAYKASSRNHYEDQLTSLIFMDSAMTNEACSKWYKFYSCLLSQTTCSYNTLLHMVHVRNPTHGHEFYSAFYERNCEGDHHKPHLQSLLDVSPTQIVKLATDITPCYTRVVNIASEFSDHRYAEAIDCIREKAEISDWTEQEKRRALHFADLLTPPWFSPESYFVAGNSDLCTIGVYGDFHVKQCNSRRLLSCYWKGHQQKHWTAVLFQSDTLYVEGGFSSVRMPGPVLMISLLTEFRVVFKTQTGEPIMEYYDGYQGSHGFRVLPSRIYKDNDVIGEGLDTVYVRVYNNSVELTQPGRGVYIVAMNHTDDISGGRTLVMRLPKEVAYQGTTMSSVPTDPNVTLDFESCIPDYSIDFIQTKWSDLQGVRKHWPLLRNRTLGYNLDQCQYVQSAAMREVCRVEAARKLFGLNDAAKYLEEWYNITLRVESKDAELQFDTSSTLFPRPRTGPAGHAQTVLPFLPDHEQDPVNLAPCDLSSDDLAIVLKSCYWASWRSIINKKQDMGKIKCGNRKVKLMLECVMQRSLCTVDEAESAIYKLVCKDDDE